MTSSAESLVIQKTTYGEDLLRTESQESIQTLKTDLSRQSIPVNKRFVDKTKSKKASRSASVSQLSSDNEAAGAGSSSV